MAKKKPEREEVKEAEPESVEVEAVVVDCEWLPKKAYFRIFEVARYFGVTEQTIRNWIAHGHFPGATQIEGPYRIPREAILRCKFKGMVVGPRL